MAVDFTNINLIYSLGASHVFKLTWVSSVCFEKRTLVKLLLTEKLILTALNLLSKNVSAQTERGKQGNKLQDLRSFCPSRWNYLPMTVVICF